MNNTQAQVIDMSKKEAPCPICGRICKRHSEKYREIKDVGDEKPSFLLIKVSNHFCNVCDKYFRINVDEYAPKKSRFSNRVHKAAYDLIVKHKYTYEFATKHMKNKYHVYVPKTTLNDWVKERGT